MPEHSGTIRGMFVHAGNTGEYRRIQGNTGEYREIQGNTGKYREIQKNKGHIVK